MPRIFTLLWLRAALTQRAAPSEEPSNAYDFDHDTFGDGCDAGLRDTCNGAGKLPPGIAQVVALDECDPASFNVALSESGGGFCHNVSLAAFGYATNLSDLLNGAENGSPDPGWDFEPDQLTIKEGTILSVVDQGGEPHTFTEVKAFGNGFLPPLNPGSATSVIPECNGGFKNIAVARTRILQAAISISPACRRASICSNAASIRGCAWKWT